MYFQADPKISREENIANAKQKTALAIALLAEHEGWQRRAFALTPKPHNFHFNRSGRPPKRRDQNEALLCRLENIATWEIQAEKFYKSEDERLAKQEQKKAEVDTETKRAKAAHKEEQRLNGAAILFLQAKGKQLNVDFNIEDAVCKANWIAFVDECNRRSSALLAHVLDEPAFVEFSGEQRRGCDDDCPGWNGTSKRCKCGNARVYWRSSSDHSFERPSIYAEAE
jgi:hypothetical protein